MDSGCKQYQILRILDNINQTPRHRLRSCCQTNTEIPAQIMLPCAVWHTGSARHRTKTIKQSFESLSRLLADVPTTCRLQQL